jgi:hypothetical protein
MAQVSLADSVILSADLVEPSNQVKFTATLTDVDPSWFGRKVRLTIGERTIMSMQCPDRAVSEPLNFGPTFLSVETMKQLGNFELLAAFEDSPSNKHTIAQHEGFLLDAISIDSAEAFFRKIQLNHSRYNSKTALYLGAKAAFLNFSDFLVQACALTVLGHRYLERELSTLAGPDFDEIKWIVEHAKLIVAEGCRILEANPNPQWDYVRWTLSLATVAANLSLCRDEIEDARYFFGVNSRHVEHVKISAVSALNMTNGCMLYGLLSYIKGDEDEARESLVRGVESFPLMVAAQNMMANVWVIGDLINVARSSRQCFIGLARLGLIEAKGEPIIDANFQVDLGDLQSPVAAIIAAGLAPTLERQLEEINHSRKIEVG